MRIKFKNSLNYFILIIIISSILRILLGFFNSEANDDHIQVIRIILNEQRLPNLVEDCGQCYHTKLYYLISATVLKIFSIDSLKSQILAAQLINVLAGIMTIYVVYKFINKTRLSIGIKLISFSLIAFNPQLIAINAQATNDTFAIFFSTIAIYFFYEFMGNSCFKNFFFMIVTLILAQLSKETTLPLIVAFILCLLIKLFSSLKYKHDFKEISRYFILFLFISILTVPLFAGYYGKYANYGDPFKTNAPKCSLPNFFEETQCGRPGVISIFNSFLTFRIIDLIKNPIITNGQEPIPKHRTSLWTQLYGRLNFIRFDSWPPSWQTQKLFILNLGRFIFILALLPLLILIYGVFINGINNLKAIKKEGLSYFNKTNNWIFIIICMTYLLFIILVNTIYRDFSWMKIIYIFPALLAFLKMFLDGLMHIQQSISKNKMLLNGFVGIILLLILSYILDVTLLIIQLTPWN